MLQNFSKFCLEILTLILTYFGYIIIKPLLLSKKYHNNQKSQSINFQNYNKQKGEKEVEELNKNMMTQYGKVLDKLINLRKFTDAENFFKSIKNPNIVILTIMMKGYSKNKNFAGAYQLLQTMQADPTIQPVQVTLNTYLTCCYRSNQVQIGLKFFNELQTKDIFTYSINNLFLLKKGMIKEAIQSYEDLKNSHLNIDQVFYNILINGLLKQKFYQKAYVVWQEMDKQNFIFNDFTLAVTIQLFSMLNKQDEAVEIYYKSKQDSIFVHSCIIKMFIYHNNYEMIKKVGYQIEYKDQVIYSQILMAYFNNTYYHDEGIVMLKDSYDNGVVLKQMYYQKAVDILINILTRNQQYIIDQKKALCYLQEIIQFTSENKIKFQKVTAKKLSYYYYKGFIKTKQEYQSNEKF